MGGRTWRTGMEVPLSSPRTLVAAAVLAAPVLLTGTMVPLAMASTWVPSQWGPGDSQVDADPTPTPEPSPTPSPTPTPEATPTPDPTPTPEPTPTPTPTPAATPTPSPIEEAVGAINAYSVLDQDGDATTDDDWLQLPYLEFAADFGPAQVDVARPVADEFGVAWWFITYRNNTPIEITELVPDGYRLADVQCAWAPDEETVERLPVTRDGNSVSWTAVVGTTYYHDFWCTFVNVTTTDVGGATALPTLPPTDTATGDAVGSGWWPVVLIAAAGLVWSALVFLLHTPRQSRRR
jgi:hypothetical protein